MPKVSVIIPVYNVEKYLRECLDSVINQTLKDIEIICVNDGSTDNSLQILEEYAQKDERIRIINQENRGQSVARNRGLDIALGEFIAFIDSDDYILPNTLQTMLDKAISTQSDIIMMGAEAFADDSSADTIKRTENMNNWLFCTNESNYQVSTDNYIDSVSEINCVAWGKLFTKNFIEKNHLRFIDEKVVLEDNGFWIKVCSCFPEISFVEEIGLMYRIRTTSVTTDIKKKRKRKFELKNIGCSVEDALKYIKEYRGEYYKILKTQIKNSDEYARLFEINILNIFRLRWATNDKRLSLFCLDIFREKPIDKKYKVVKFCGIKIYKTKIKNNYYKELRR